MQKLVVIDTNVLISALLSKHEDAATVQVMDALFSGKIIPLIHEEIIEEYREVLHRPKFNFTSFEINMVLNAIIDNGVKTERLNSGEEIPDTKDLVFYEVVMTKQDENALLVTGNIKHFPVKPYIVTPRELLEILK